MVCLLLSCSALAGQEDQDFFRFLAEKAQQVEVEAVAAPESFQIPTERDYRVATDINRQVQTDEETQLSRPVGKYNQFRTLVFISLGMPERTLSALFKQSAGDPSIGFVLRGMTSSHIDRDMKQVQAMMPHGKQAIVFIDPLLYRDYHVTKVPFTLHKARDAHWYGVWGTISVIGARDLIERGRGGRNRPAVGEVYAIKEADMHEAMRKKFESADWDKIRAGAERRLAEKTKVDAELPVAPKDRTRIVDVSSHLQKDVIGPDGQVFARAGMKINPLDFVTLDEVFVVFDPTSRFENHIVAEWHKRYPAMTLVATHWDPLIQSKYDAHVYVLDALFKSRFAIEHTPSLIEQVGNRMRVTEVRPRP